ncbi:4'-phosphopantetheinyl transferase superfamily protein [Wenyingzhuangia sp. chi5]|uniref:4'-phosphopantetheinyl transferase superfamily protein n=1 Tax=Wenyingzhuangia gilva TaxID=3057677 RepID=A0ABT8VQI3_9FLAO|nr:4'-phosphopantetheinyl transferase superfamily protein [Wenyingzhuangia sp. chi5]MDO3694235.1 4'-phosphopantetheinyl transferase superfamily protein [Wenyingzhuangia sp. chi5]
MPLFKTIQINPNTTVYVWKITESINVLRDMYLSKNSLNRVNLMKSESHQKGFLSIRHLLKHINLNDDDLFYNEFGKPLLRNHQHISITHSYDFSAIVISNESIGIDLEKNRDKIKVIKHRFTDLEQNNLSDKEYIKQLTFIWGGKEAMFKIHPCGGMSFKNDLIVLKMNQLNAKGYINTPELKQNCDIYFFQIENYSLAIATTNNELA